MLATWALQTSRDGKRRIVIMAKLDNIDLDMRDAARLGYGVQYGRFKADHPFTKDANEERLTGKQKKQPAPEKVSIKQVHEKLCPICGKKFITTTKLKKYCCPKCREKAGNTAWTHSRTK
jgi:hypothetical protein